MQNEIFKLEIDNKIIQINHSGYKLFSEQSEGAIPDLKEFLKECLEKGMSNGRIPYNNFECFFTFETIGG